MPQFREVVITGAGVVSPIGIGKQALWKSLCERRSGVAPIAAWQQTRLPARFGAEVRDFDAKQYVSPRKTLKVMCREIQMGYAAAILAVQDAGLKPTAVESGPAAAVVVDPERFGIVFGEEFHYSVPEDMLEVARHCVVEGHFEYDRWGSRAMSDIFPLWLLKYLPNMTACHLAIALEARGPNNSITIGEASSLSALIESARIIARGHADVMIAGGTGSRLNLTALIHRGDCKMSLRNDDPASASRPFDAARDGMVNGEGAGAIVLESREHATARGANILARVLGDSLTFDPPANNSVQHENGFHRVIRAALRSAELEPGQIGHVNAHGLSTQEDDRAEARAIRDCLGDVPVTAPKSFFGNLGAGGGAVETIVSLCALAAGEIPVTLNYQTPDPNCPLRLVFDEPRKLEQPTALLLNKSGSGQVAAVVIAAP